jgi:hypothetical protein
MNQISRSVDSDFTVLNRRGTPHGPLRRLLRHFIHFFSYHPILSRQSIRTTRAAGFRLGVYRDVAALFKQAGERLKPDGRLYVMVSSDYLDLFGRLLMKPASGHDLPTSARSTSNR